MPLISSSNKFRICCWLFVSGASAAFSPEDGKGGSNEGVETNLGGEARFCRMIEVLRNALEASWLLLSIPPIAVDSGCLPPLLMLLLLSRVAIVVVGSGENSGDCQDDLPTESKPPQCKTLPLELG